MKHIYEFIYPKCTKEQQLFNDQNLRCPQVTRISHFHLTGGAAHREICQAINRLLYSKLYRENNALKLYISAAVFGLRRQRMSRFYLFIFILLKLQIANTFLL